MLATFIISVLFTNSLAQLNGEFWWLNPKLDKYREVSQVSQPEFEDLSESETDQSARIIFRDDPIRKEEQFGELKIEKDKNFSETGKFNKAIWFQDKSEITWPEETKGAIAESGTPSEGKQVNNSSKLLSTGDVLEIKFPDENNLIWRVKHIINSRDNKTKPVTKNNTKNMITGTITLLNDKKPIKGNKNVPSDSEHICTYMKKRECSRLRGVVYIKHEGSENRPYFETQMICCILPMRPELDSSKIYFVDSDEPYKRSKRSSKEVSPSLKQRHNLLLKKFGAQSFNAKVTTQSPLKHRVVTPSVDYIDPYWNIKGSNSKHPNKDQKNQFQQTSKYEYESEDYIEDYVVELPSPGLVGIYSDHGPTRPSWTFPTDPIGPYGDIDSVEDDTPAFGYSPTVDPRLEDRRPTSKQRINGRPVKLSTASNERLHDAESQTINYQSNPDFQVLQGFKLLNLVRNKSRIYRNGKKTTTEKFFDDKSQEHVLTASLENDYDDDGFLDSNQQVFRDCGRIAKGSNRYYESGAEIGDSEKGSHPSLGLVVLTKRKQSILCYSTIVHPRAAITAGDCVFRKSPGEIMLIAGAWRLDEENHEEWQKRMATVHLHSKHKPGDLAHNLALLYWKRPLRLTADVQPACLSEPHVGDDCKFFGWGGYDQAIRKQSRWQRSVVLAPRTCAERVSKRLPSDAFCSSVQSRGTVTGTGGALMCNVGDRQSAVGVAVWRDLAVVLIPVRDWIARAIDDLQLQ